MTRIWLTGLVLCLGLPAQGQDLSADEFEALTEGMMLESRHEDGSLYGHELFLPGRETLWQPPDGECEKGKWQVVGDYICYFYEFNNPGDCVKFSLSGDEIIGVEQSGYKIIHRIVDPSVMTCERDIPMSSILGDRNLKQVAFSR